MKNAPRGVGVEGLPTTARKWRLAMTAVEDGDPPSGELDHDVPGGGGEPASGCVEIQPVWPLGRPGRRTCSHEPALLALRWPRTGRTVRDPGQRPAGGDRFDPTRVRAWPGPGDVIVQEHDKRLARRDPGGGGSGRSDEGAADRRRDQRRRQRRTPPARAGGARGVGGRGAHPVN